MDVGLFIQYIGLTLLALLMILTVKRFNINALEPWDYVFFFFAGPLWILVFPMLIVYLGVYHVKTYCKRK